MKTGNHLVSRAGDTLGWFTCATQAQGHTCSYVERKRKQNEIRTRISVSQDGGNLVSSVRLTLDQQLGNEDSGNEIKDVT